jgi:predicted nicotinamide N-methyase
MDFLEKSALPKGVRVLDVGCGWGLGGIYCAKKYGATVTGADIDPKVFPYLRLHAEINSVSVATILKGIDELTYSFLKDVDVIIGADICFWDTLGGSLERLVSRALDSGVKLVLIADPGRLPFDKFGEELVHNMKGQMWTRTVQHPYFINGKVLKIGSIHS